MTPGRWAPAFFVLAAAGACTQIQQALPGAPYHTSFEGRLIDQLEPPASPDEVAGRTTDAEGDDAKALSGRGKPLSLLDSEGLVAAPAFEAYLQQILNRALEPYPYDLKPMTIGIDASGNVAAWATPGNEIYVTLGLLENLECEGELATVLAHEAGHVQLDHFFRSNYLEDQRNAVTASAGVAMVAVTASNMRLGRSGGKLTLVNADAKETEEKTAQAATLAWLINSASDQVLNGHWSRKQEQEADLFATDLAVAAGYNPRAPADLFQLLGRLWGEQLEYEAFLEAEGQRVGEDLAAQGTPIEVLNALAPRLVVFGATLKDEAWRRLGLGHIDIDERRTAVLEYGRREYRGQRVKAAEREAEAERYRNALRTGLPEAVRARHRAAHEAQRLLAEGKLAEAEERAQFAVTRPTAGSAHTRTVLYMVRKAQGRDDQALASLERIRDAFRPRRVFEFQASEYLARERYDDALAILDAGARQFDTAEPFLPARIGVQVAMGRIEEAWQSHATCQQAASTALRSLCDAAIEGAPQIAGTESNVIGLQERLADVKGFFGGLLPGSTPPGLGPTE